MSNNTPSSTRSTYWQPHIEQWQQSGQTQRAFCREHELNYDQFVYWRKKLSPPTVKPTPRANSSFVPVTLAASPSPQGLSLYLPNGMQLHGLSQANLPVVQQLLAHLS